MKGLARYVGLIGLAGSIGASPLLAIDSGHTKDSDDEVYVMNRSNELCDDLHNFEIGGRMLVRKFKGNRANWLIDTTGDGMPNRAWYGGKYEKLLDGTIIYDKNYIVLNFSCLDKDLPSSYRLDAVWDAHCVPKPSKQPED